VLPTLGRGAGGNGSGRDHFLGECKVVGVVKGNSIDAQQIDGGSVGDHKLVLKNDAERLPAGYSVEQRDRWVHSRGWFQAYANGRWREAIGTDNHYFNELGRNDSYVELHNVVKGTTRIRLYRDRCDVAFAPAYVYKTFYGGAWAK
jgi:hypothetical protein